MKPHDVILLLQDWTRRHFIVELTDTSDMLPGATSTTTNLVHHISEMDVTTDVCLDSMPVVPHVPPGNTVMVGKGRVQWFRELIELNSPMESPPLPAFSTFDCDPYIADTTRWSLLCIRVDNITGDRVLFWVHAKPGMGYPNVPYNGVPLALVRTSPGVLNIQKEDILNWRSIRPGYAPSAMYWFEPVDKPEDLSMYTDPPEGASCLVLEEGVNYYYRNGAWRRAGAPSFDNTAFYVDIDTATTRVDLPWPVTSATELTVFRDGMFMLLDKDYYVYTGFTPYLIFTYNLVPGQRIVVVKNPFFAQAYSAEVKLSANQIHDIYVDGMNGSDSYDGSQPNPFQTLQHAFDVIPTFSNHTYRVHATNLQRADMVSAPDNTVQRCYGYLIGKRVTAIQLFIDSNYEWYESQDEYVAYINSVNSVSFIGDTPITYHVLLVNCNTSFLSTPINAGLNGMPRVVIEGGIVAMDNVRQNDATFDFICRGSCIVKSDRCMFKKLSVQAGAYLNMTRGSIEHLSLSSHGICDASSVVLTESVDAVESLLYLHSCTISNVEGNFSGGLLHVEDVAFPRRWDPAPAQKRFFYGHHGASFTLVNVTITHTPFSSIYMAYNCTLSTVGGFISNSTAYAVEIDHSCVAVFNGTNFENNQKSAVYADYHCSVEFYNAGGLGNLRYGCECYNISRANFVNTWTWGALGQYYEVLPGADTVLADRVYDQIPGTLEQKIDLGQGLTHSIVPTTSPSDYRYKIDVDVEELIGTGGQYGSPLLDLTPRLSVYEVLSQILPPPDPSSTPVIPIRWTGTSYMSSVTRKIFDPTPQNKVVATTSNETPWFIQEDEWNGTSALLDGITLVNFPLGVGYKVNSPHFFFTDYQEYGALRSYGIQQLQSFTVEADVPAGTRLQVGFSVHGSVRWLQWNSGTLTWDELPGSSTLIQMQSAPDWSVVNAWPVQAWDALRQANSNYITVCFLLSTTSSLLTPKVKSFTWSYVEDGYLEDITQAFQKFYYTNRAEFRYDGSLGVIDPPIYFSVMPTADRR